MQQQNPGKQTYKRMDTQFKKKTVSLFLSSFIHSLPHPHPPVHQHQQKEKIEMNQNKIKMQKQIHASINQ